MIHIFRRMRKKLMEQPSKGRTGNKTRTYLLYALGEIALVMIGILLALQVNNWNEQRQQQNISLNTLKSLEIELQEAKSGLIGVISDNRDILEDSEKYIYRKYSKDSLKADPGTVFSFTNYSTVSLNMPVLERELSSDRLIQGEEALITRIREIKAGVTRMTESFYYLDEFWNTQVTPYFIEKKVMVYLHQDLRNSEEISLSNIEQVFDDEEYRNLAAMCNLFTSSFTVQAEGLVNEIDETLALIEEIK